MVVAGFGNDRMSVALNSPQDNKTGNKNCAHVLNKPVKVTSSSTKNSREKKTAKKRCRYMLTG